MLIQALNTDPRLLNRQIKSYEATIKSINWSIDWHLKNVKGASETDKYVISLREQLLVAQNFLAQKQMLLQDVSPEEGQDCRRCGQFVKDGDECVFPDDTDAYCAGCFEEAESEAA